MLNDKKPAFWLAAVAVAACVAAGVWFLTNPATAASQKLKINDPQKIVLRSISGERAEITDDEAVQEITDSFTSIQFERGESSKNMNGFGPIVTWYDAEDNVITALSVMSDETIDYTGYYWTATDGSMDVDMIRLLITGIAFRAVILEIDTRMDSGPVYLVEVTEDGGGFRSGNRVYVPLGNAAPSPEPKVGDMVEVTFRGDIAETDPAHITDVTGIRVIRQSDMGMKQGRAIP